MDNKRELLINENHAYETIKELDSQIYKLTNSKSKNISPKSPSDDTHISY